MDLHTCDEGVRLSVAEDVGRIELMHARFNRRTVPPHIHDEYSISVTLRGGLAFDFRGTKYTAPEGVISCVAPGEVHNAYAACGDEWEFINLLVPTAVVHEILSGIGALESLPDLPRRVVVDAEMVRRFVDLYRVLETGEDLLERQSARALVLTEFFQRHSTLRGVKRSAGSEHRAVQRARQLLRDCYAEPISLTRLAEHVGLSPYHFLRTFHTAVGMTPHNYLTQIRVLEARRRLSSDTRSAEIAAACGFCDQSHMTRQFKRISMVTPGQYRRAVRPRRLAVLPDRVRT